MDGRTMSLLKGRFALRYNFLDACVYPFLSLCYCLHRSDSTDSSTKLPFFLVLFRYFLGYPKNNCFLWCNGVRIAVERV